MGKPGKHPNDMADPCWPQDPGGGLVPWPLAGAVAEPRGHAHAGDVPRGPPEPEKKKRDFIALFGEKLGNVGNTVDNFHVEEVKHPQSACCV